LPNDLEIDAEKVTVKNGQGFRGKTPPVKVLEPGESSTQGRKILLVQDLYVLGKWDKVRFSVSDVKLPRYQGEVKDSVVVQTVDTAMRVIDEGTMKYFVKKAISFEGGQITSSSLVNREKTNMTFSLQIPSQISI